MIGGKSMRLRIVRDPNRYTYHQILRATRRLAKSERRGAA